MNDIFFTHAKALTLFFLLIALNAFAQTTQYGRVVEQNSNGRSVAGVMVEVPSSPDCQPTSSGANGFFRLVFSEHQPGDVIHGIRIKKYGYEVVNHHVMHEGWTLTEKDTLRIVLAPEGTVSEARRRYYQYLEEAYLTRYDSIASFLHSRYAQQLMTEQEFNTRMEQAVSELNLSFQNLDMYADQLARMNQDDLDMDIDVMLNTFVDFPAMPKNYSENTVALSRSTDFDFLYKGLNFIEACVFFGDFYMELDMKEDALNYYTLALKMCETLDGYEGASFTNQIRQLRSIIAKIDK